LIDNFVPCEIYNILIIGDSRAGKTTFVNLLSAKTLLDIEKVNVWHGTRNPISSVLYNNYNGKDIILKIIDTPGFGEASSLGGGRSDSELRNIITEFTKSDITTVNLILITLNASNGLVNNQVQMILDLMQFFGNKFNLAFGLLITHFDNKTVDVEQKWLDSLQENVVMKNLVTSVLGNRIFFTGSYIQTIEKETFDTFMILQNERKKKFLDELMITSPISFKNKGSGIILPLDIYESAKLTSLNLRILPQENEKLMEKILELRKEFKILLEGRDFLNVEDLKIRIERIMEATKPFEDGFVKLTKPDENI